MFSVLLLEWDQLHNRRQMPWKGISNPYHIWLSEIIMQQTRVEQGEQYYLRLISNYPTIRDLALADDEAVFRDWQGLGYYSRCRNMLQAARDIYQHQHGIFPKTYEEIRKLKGVGDYTAAAIASFAFNLPHAVVDGNVVRVLSRVFADPTSFHTTAGKRKFQELAYQLMPKSQIGIYNQAMMDLGATVCLPRNPRCEVCPFETICKAKNKNEIDRYPSKKIKAIIKNRYFHFLVMRTGRQIYIQKRTGRDIWRDLYSFPTVETSVRKKPIFDGMPPEFPLPEPERYTQMLTHQKIHGSFYEVKPSATIEKKWKGLTKIALSDLKGYAFPRMIVSFLENKNYL